MKCSWIFILKILVCYANCNIEIKLRASVYVWWHWHQMGSTMVKSLTHLVWYNVLLSRPNTNLCKSKPWLCQNNNTDSWRSNKIPEMNAFLAPSLSGLFWLYCILLDALPECLQCFIHLILIKCKLTEYIVLGWCDMVPTDVLPAFLSTDLVRNELSNT